MKRLTLLSFLTLSILQVDSCLAVDLSSVHMLGVRMGFWNAVKAKNVQAPPGEEILSKVTAPYGEFFGSVGLTQGFALEFSLGSNYRGETRYSDTSRYSYWKRVTIYPISGQLTNYPLFSAKRFRLKPYVDAGVGLVSGVENLRLDVYGDPYRRGTGTNSYLTFGWHAGGGMDFVLSRHLVICADFKYRRVRFGDDVGGLKDFSGPESAFGLAYILKGT